MSDERLYMSHPDLEDYPPTPVVRSQLPHMHAAGWVECDPPPEPEPETDKDTDDGDDTGAEPTKTSRRRSASKSKD